MDFWGLSMLKKLKFIKPIIIANFFLLLYVGILHAVEMSSVKFNDKTTAISRLQEVTPKA